MQGPCQTFLKQRWQKQTLNIFPAKRCRQRSEYNYERKRKVNCVWEVSNYRIADHGVIALYILTAYIQFGDSHSHLCGGRHVGCKDCNYIMHSMLIVLCFFSNILGLVINHVDVTAPPFHFILQYSSFSPLHIMAQVCCT